MNDPKKLAEALNRELDALHDKVVSADPFTWSDSEKDRGTRVATFDHISKALTEFVYVPKTGLVTKILIFGTAVPLVLLAILYFAHVPADEKARFFAWGGCAVVAVVFAIVAVVVADAPNIGSDLALAAYTVPRGWSFSRYNASETWEAYVGKFGYFNQGDENRHIGTRMWGYAAEGRKQPFQLFHFHFDEVRWETEVYTDAKGNLHTRTVRRVYPHDRYGMFLAMPESAIRFRVTEVCGGAGLDTHIKLEYGELNKAINVHCGSKDELAVRQFLSPAVQEVVMRLSKEISDLHLDFYPGLVMVATENDFLSRVDEIELDEQAPRFAEFVRLAEADAEQFKNYFVEHLRKIQKYND